MKLQVYLKGQWHYVAYIQGRTIVTTRVVDRAAPATRRRTVKQIFPHMNFRTINVIN